ncbi:MAG: NTP transferase domain-containing protein [Selenomonadaceae bacterium]|nr:NTP transferase domain-containing protein [Selenomonadaceae bacterium]
MSIEYIVIQAGGEGTRLGSLTKNRPKAIVPVKNRPIIFHLFEKYPKAKYIIIGDYKYEVLERYLRNFSSVDYLLIKAEGKGNAAGVKKALDFLPDGVPFMLLWSDLLLSSEWETPQNIRECYVGIFKDILCSWRMEGGKLKKEPSNRNGVAGCFTFENKERLYDIPDSGSFTFYLANSGLTLTSMDMRNSLEVGTLEAVKKLDPPENRCRPYNRMEFIGDKVIKTGLTDEAIKLIERETNWYKKVSNYGFKGIPKIYSYSPLTMETIEGENIFRAKLNDEQKKRTIDKLVDALEILHGYESAEPDYLGLEEDYYTKTLKRLHSIREVIPFSNDPYIVINNKPCRNVLCFEDKFEKSAREHLFNAKFGPIHGDCTLTNTMIDNAGNIYYIDARGYFGKREIFGDIYYDWAKLYYSINGKFDNFNVKAFELSIKDNEVQFKICDNGWSHLTEYFLSKIKYCNLSKIKLIHSIIWMSLASHCWEDYDSMCLAFYNGVWLWNDWMEQYETNGNVCSF